MITRFTRRRPVVALSVTLLLGTACQMNDGLISDLFRGVEGTLRECASATHCPSERAICASGTCVECVADLDCSASELVCVDNSCVASGFVGDDGSRDAGGDVVADAEPTPSDDEESPTLDARPPVPDAEPPALDAESPLVPDAEPPALDAGAPTAPEPPRGPGPRR